MNTTVQSSLGTRLLPTAFFFYSPEFRTLTSFSGSLELSPLHDCADLAVALFMQASTALPSGPLHRAYPSVPPRTPSLTSPALLSSLIDFENPPPSLILPFPCSPPSTPYNAPLVFHLPPLSLLSYVFPLVSAGTEKSYLIASRESNFLVSPLISSLRCGEDDGQGNREPNPTPFSQT